MLYGDWHAPDRDHVEQVVPLGRSTTPDDVSGVIPNDLGHDLARCDVLAHVVEKQVDCRAFDRGDPLLARHVEGNVDPRLTQDLSPQQQEQRSIDIGDHVTTVALRRACAPRTSVRHGGQSCCPKGQPYVYNSPRSGRRDAPRHQVVGAVASFIVTRYGAQERLAIQGLQDRVLECSDRGGSRDVA